MQVVDCSTILAVDLTAHLTLTNLDSISASMANPTA